MRFHVRFEQSFGFCIIDCEVFSRCSRQMSWEVWLRWKSWAASRKHCWKLCSWDWNLSYSTNVWLAILKIMTSGRKLLRTYFLNSKPRPVQNEASNEKDSHLFVHPPNSWSSNGEENCENADSLPVNIETSDLHFNAPFILIGLLWSAINPPVKMTNFDLFREETGMILVKIHLCTVSPYFTFLHERHNPRV